MPFEKILKNFFPEALVSSDSDRSLIRSLAVLIFATAAIPLAAATLTLYLYFSHSYKQKTDAHLVDILQLQRRGIDDFLDRSGGAAAAAALKRIHLDDSARAYIFDRGNRLLAPSAEGSGGNPEAALTAELWERVDEGGGDGALLKTKDSTGRDAIFTAAAVNSGRWLLVVALPAAEAYGQQVGLYTTAVMTAAAGAAAVLILALVVSVWAAGRLAGKQGQTSAMKHTMVETDKLSSIGELATGVAHEINNPVAVMIEEAGWVQDLLEDQEFADAKNREEIGRALQQIQVHGNRCKEITSKLLSFAKKTATTVEDIALNEMLEELVAVSTQSARNIDVTIRSRFEDPLPMVRTNYPELQQIFVNIINNALDAMEGRGGELVLSTRQDHDFIEVTLSDTGSGIAGPNLHRIFDPFFSTKQVGRGTGLGLSICYGFINQMGGRIEVESEVDVGSTFRVYLPIAKQ